MPSVSLRSLFGRTARVPHRDGGPPGTGRIFTHRGSFQLSALFAAAALGLVMSNGDMQSSVLTGAKAAKAAQQDIAAKLMGAMGSLGDGFVTMLGGNTVTAAQITWDAAAGTGLFNPTDGGVGFVPVPQESLTASALAASRGWVYRSNLTPRQIGTGNPTYAVTVVGVKDAVCRQINYALRITTTDATAPPASGLSATAWNASATALDLSGVTAVTGKRLACLQTSDGEYAVYRTLQDG